MLKKSLLCNCNVIHQDAVLEALKSRPQAKDLMALSQLFKLIGDPTRTKILCTLDKHEMCVCDIASVLNMTKSSISHQLAILRDAGIVKFRRSGKEVFYTLDDQHIKQLYELGLTHIMHKRDANHA